MALLEYLSRSRWRVAALGYGGAIALSGVAGVLAKAFPRDLSGSLNPLVLGMTLVALSAVAATTIGLIFWQSSSRTLVALLAASLAVAIIFQVIVGSEANEPVIFSPGLLTPLGVFVAVGSVIVLAVRGLLRHLASVRASRAGGKVN